MLKRILAGLLVVAAGCDLASASADPAPLQGVVELQERVLAFELPGRIEGVGVTEGDTVEAGTRLAWLDDAIDQAQRDVRAADMRAAEAALNLLQAGSRPEDIRSTRAELQAARSDHRLAEQNLGRIRKLVSSGAGTGAELDAATAAVAVTKARINTLEQHLRIQRNGAREQEIQGAVARVEAAQAAVRAADERIARHVLVADAPGVVLDVLVEPGEFSGVGAPVLALADTQHPYVDVFVPQGRIAGVEVGRPAQVRVDALDHPLAGEVENIARTTEFTPKFLFSPRERPNLVIRVRIRIDDPLAELRAGVPAFVTLEPTE